MDKFIKRFFPLAVIVMILLEVLPNLQVVESTEQFNEAVNILIRYLPFFAIAMLIMTVLSAWVESSDELPSFNVNRLKFWEWRIRYYIPFYFITIILTGIIDKDMGFIISIILSWISLYKVIREHDIQVKKEGKKGEG